MNIFLKILKNSDLSICELARCSGVPLRTIQNWIYNGVDPTVGNLEKVLNALGYEIKIEKIVEEKEFSKSCNAKTAN